ncbi:hypothetical protein PMAYCL1PPCAC_09224, partial [Pristionchus mayeri]
PPPLLLFSSISLALPSLPINHFSRWGLLTIAFTHNLFHKMRIFNLEYFSFAVDTSEFIRRLAMAFNLLELPREIIIDIVQRIDYKGLLTLSKVCWLTKELADVELSKLTKKHRARIFYWSCLNELCFETISRQRLNIVRMGVHDSMERKLRAADAVYGLLLVKNGNWRPPEEPVSQAVQLLSRRCNHLELEAAWLSENGLQEAIRKLSLFDKKVYLYTRVKKAVANRREKVGSLNVSVVDNFHLEIFHDGMRRRNIS